MRFVDQASIAELQSQTCSSFFYGGVQRALMIFHRKVHDVPVIQLVEEDTERSRAFPASGKRAGSGGDHSRFAGIGDALCVPDDTELLGRALVAGVPATWTAHRGRYVAALRSVFDRVSQAWSSLPESPRLQASA